jgi:hypothetical protein
MEEHISANKQHSEFLEKNRPNRLKQIVEKIEEITNKTDISESEKIFYQLTGEWDTLTSTQKNLDEQVQKQYWEAVERFKKTVDWVIWANLKKKEDICTQLTQLEASIENQNLVERFNELRSLWKETGPIPAHKMKEINRSFRTLCGAIYEKCLVVYKEREQEKEKNLKLKESLCEEIESLTEASNWKQATEFVQKIQQNWDACGPVPKESSDIVWERFKKACANFFEKRKHFYQARKLMLKENQKRKKELCEKIEALKDSTDWKETSQKIKALQQEWQTVGPSARPHEEALWNRFRAACDDFFNAQKAFFDSREKDKPQNMEKKLLLCNRAENIGNFSYSEKYKKILDLQAEWKQIGPIPKEMEDEIWKRFRKPIDAFFEERKSKFEEEKHTREKNQKSKEDLCSKAELICNSNDWNETADKIKELQREWKQIGPAQREIENSLWQRFHAACETFFIRLKEFNQRQKNDINMLIQKKLDLCFQAEIITGMQVSKIEEEERAEWQLAKLAENFWFRVLDEDENNWDARAQKLKDLQKEWKEIGPIPSERDRLLWKRFQNACNFFFNSKK